MPGLRIVLPNMVSRTYVHERSVSFGLSNYCFPYSADVVLQAARTNPALRKASPCGLRVLFRLLIGGWIRMLSNP